MLVMSAHVLDQFWRRFPDAEQPLRRWLTFARTAGWQNIKDVRETFRTADGVAVSSGRTITVFNVRGNHYRLLVGIDFPLQTARVLLVLTHAEYDKEKWKETL
jgi:mRNA interferase HigB